MIVTSVVINTILIENRKPNIGFYYPDQNVNISVVEEVPVPVKESIGANLIPLGKPS